MPTSGSDRWACWRKGPNVLFEVKRQRWQGNVVVELVLRRPSGKFPWWIRLGKKLGMMRSRIFNGEREATTNIFHSRIRVFFGVSVSRRGGRASKELFPKAEALFLVAEALFLSCTLIFWRMATLVAFQSASVAYLVEFPTATSPLFREARSVLAIAIPTVTNAATRAQVALRTVLEDFDSQFPEVRSLLERSLSRRMVHTLSRNSGFESIISASEPVFDYDRIIRYGDVVESGAELFPLETLRDTQNPSLREAIRSLLSKLQIESYTPASPPPIASTPPVSPSRYSPIANPSPSLPTPAVALPVLQRPPEAIEEIEYMGDAQISGLDPGVDEEEVDKESEEDAEEGVSTQLHSEPAGQRRGSANGTGVDCDGNESS
ncbi:hypothetical protein BDP27DRAFT_1368539 [Rhodocollybia butyracea]|uniref:Uncharacterized protein n=1 Tax=Rhodocollybia butyracea TaxID=206335 RepID=A0A9P5PIR9_9AGAR|nr:hypothetical protein BDP27DRAFT_1368539 [Rhodocollybia butyracea]